MPDLSVIIVNYNTADYLQRCLSTVLAQEEASFEILVVDNASSDQSVAMVRAQFPQVRLLASPDNLGFAKANNLAARQASGRYLFYLNPDTVVKPGCLATMLAFMDQHPDIGLAGTRILYPDATPQGSVETSYPGQRHSHGELAGLPGDIAWLLGASLVARREVMAAVHGFSEEFFLYGEDIDLGLKVRRAGWRLGFCPDAVIVHWEGKSEQGTQPAELLRKKLAAEALFYQRHYRRDTVLDICRANIRQARWRLFSLHLQGLLSRKSAVVRGKQERYRQVLAFFRALATTLCHP